MPGRRQAKKLLKHCFGKMTSNGAERVKNIEGSGQMAASFLFCQLITIHKACPCIHHGPTLVQQVRTVVRSFYLVLHRMS